MNWFKNLKIAKKLILSFFIVALIAGIIGYEGIVSLKEADDSDTVLYEMHTVPLSILGKISTAYERERANILEVLFAKDAALRADQHKRIADRSAEVDQLISEYKKSIKDDLDKKLFEEFSNYVTTFDALREKVLMLSDKNDFEGARSLYQGDMEIARKKVEASFEKLDEMNIKDAKERSHQNTVEANSSITFMAIFVFGGVLLAIFLGIFISKIIGNPVKLLTDAATKIAAGDTSVIVKVASRDEFGTLATTFNAMVEKIEMQIQYLENLPTPVMIVDKEYNVTYLNKMGAQVVGKTQESCSNQKCYNLFKTGHCNTPECRVRQAMEQKSIRSGETIAKPQGKDIHIMYTGSPVIDRTGALVGGLEFVADISESKENQNYLARSTNALLREMDKFADGDLTVEVVPEKENDDIGRLFNGFNKSVQNIKDIVANVISAVQATASASTQISSSTEEMAAGAQEQSAQTTEIAGAIEQMTSTIFQTTKNASSAAEQAKKAGIAAEEGGSVIKETIDGMNRIAEVVKNAASTVQELGASSEQIGAIVQVIDDIADQTNLLALNAAIEAARAGEQGRGFAVVADEVRKLAERTTKATKEIGEMIKKIQKETGGAVKSMELGTNEVEKGKEFAEKSGRSLKEIIVSANGVVDVINQVAAASEEQSTAAEQISRSIEGISSVTQQSAAGIQQTARAADDLNNLTVNLQNLIDHFKIDSGKRNGRLSVRENGVLVKS